MKKLIKLSLFLCIGANLLYSADKEWLPKGSSIDTYEYNSNQSRSPAAFSSINSNSLSSKEKKGQKIYSKWCLPCHGEGMPATNALQVAYEGALPALLEAREDLSPEFVETFVRAGKHSMPFFRKTEISDEELKLLGEYLQNAHKYLKKR
ncbi:p-cresol methylhydroxylase [Campylobacter sp. MIT 99-7217]|uniref:c-type cytochrome n=1 Tax=Campylobacter sp. MIT 99-7217 TaxID=535091 RepID=UPI001158F0EA|nr:cytochrome c [Campylobacter sp. MIT 99-7217]TQR34728.1 p-cresol methylhydroxylase [Campylobacter sp. MIT 99-7217]